MSATREKGSEEPKRVFVISPIGGPDSPERLRADRFLKYIVRVALPTPEYEVERADEHDSPLAITAAMLSSIVNSHICVADISGRNPNVFYELALAHAMDKHVVIMDGDMDRSPFDIQDQRAIKYGLMPDEIENAVAQLRAKASNVNNAAAFKDMMNPVATAFRAWTTQQRVESSGDSTEQMLLRVVERLEEKVDRVERRSDFEDRTLGRSASAESIGELRTRAKRALIEFETQIAEGIVDASLTRMVEAGYRLLQEDRKASAAGLHRFLIDAEYVERRARYGERVTHGQLPSQRETYRPDDI